MTKVEQNLPSSILVPRHNNSAGKEEKVPRLARACLIGCATHAKCYQLSDVHSSSATRSRFGSEASSCSAGSGEGPPLCIGIIKCGWTGISCGMEAGPAPPVLALPSDPATTVADSEVIICLPCCESSVLNCTTDAEDNATLDSKPNMLNVSAGIITCLHTTPKDSYLCKYQYTNSLQQELSDTTFSIGISVTDSFWRKQNVNIK